MGTVRTWSVRARRRTLVPILVISTVVAQSGLVAAAAGDLDTSFGTGGISTGKVDAALGPTADYVEGFTILPDGRLVTTGYVPTTNYSDAQAIIAVFGQDGELDPGFSGDGVVLMDFGAYDELDGVAYQPGLGIVAVGYSSSEFIATRLELDGDLDTTFGTNGIVHFAPLGDTGSPWKVVIDDQNRIVVTGYLTNSSPHVMVGRLEPDGALDPTFDSDGILDTGLSGYGTNLTLDASGRILVTTSVGFNVLRVTETGALDPTFAGDGIATLDLDTYEESFDVSVDASGRVVAVGYAQDGVSHGAVVVARFDESGVPDTTFDIDGVALVEPTGSVGDTAIVVDALADGRVVVAGRVSAQPGVDFVVMRLAEDGTLDPSFAGGGFTTTGIGDNDFVIGMGIDTDGGIVVAGSSIETQGTTSDITLVRYLPDPPPDTSAPDTTITGGPASPTTDPDATFTFSGSDDLTAPGALTFECSTDGAPFAPCASPTLVTVGPGDHTFSVRAVDAALNVDASPATYPWTTVETAGGNATPETGGEASTGDDPSVIDPVEATVIVPGGTAGGPISITEIGTPSVPAPTGYDLLGNEVQISAPAGTPANPLELRFVFDGQVAADAGLTAATIQLLRNGTPVAQCVTTGPISPDPCINSRNVTPLGDIELVVLTSVASAWSFAAHEPFFFAGFFQPVDNQPTVNRAKAGASIPVRFTLGGDKGLDIFGLGYPASQQIACSGGVPLDLIEQTATAGSSGLSYDVSSDTYTYIWKTSKGWSGTCRQLVLQFVDETQQSASFSLAK